jgi:ribosomal protein S18 acetylase RimI-like enzyme
VLSRDAAPADMAAVGELRVVAYREGKHLAENSEYEQTLRSLGADGDGDVLVAVGPGPGEPAETIDGTVMLQLWPHAGEAVRAPDEAEIRALAVAPSAQGAGVGTALLHAVIERATAHGVRHLVLFTQTDMKTAQHMYDNAGFTRLPDRDWVLGPDFRLIAYGLVLAGR